MIPRYDTLTDLVEQAFSSYGSFPAYTCAGHTLSFKQLDELSRRFASYCHHQLGLQPGDRIGLQMPNILQYPVALYGAIRAGLVIVNINPLYTPRELAHQLNDSGAKALVVLSNIALAASQVVKDTQVEHVIVTDFADLHPTPKRQIINFVVKHVKKMVPSFAMPTAIPFREVINCPAKALKPVMVNAASVAALQYTGGTTGISKGAMLTHGNLCSNVWQCITLMPEAFPPGKEVFIACLPLYHIYALNLNALAAFSYGEHNILIPNPRDLKALVAAVKNVGMTVIIGINTLYVALARYAPSKTIDFSKLRVSCAGGMAMTEDAARMWKELSGCEVCEGYGLTEASPVICGNKVSSIRFGTIGKALIETEIKLIDDAGNTVPDGEPGELCARGPQVMPGYWNKPDETAKVLTPDGWLKTGDVAIKTPDGYYKIVDRKKDMILVSGFNVYPNEIEDIVTSHPDIIEAAAIGVPDEKSGEAVKLFVVRSRPDLSEEEIKQFCKERLTAYKRPRSIEFRDSLPKSNVGKILRRELREKSH